MKAIGPSFNSELIAAGLAGLPMSWGSDGQFLFGNMSADQIAAVQAVYDAHNPDAAAVEPSSSVAKLAALLAAADVITVEQAATFNQDAKA